MKRTEVLNNANQIVHGDRQEAYGTPENNFSKIAGMWSAYLGVPVSAEDVAAMMILLKTARVKSGHGSDDNWVDIAGYAACGGEIQSRGKDEAPEDPAEMRWDV